MVIRGKEPHRSQITVAFSFTMPGGLQALPGAPGELRCQWRWSRDVAIEHRPVLEKSDLYHPEQGEQQNEDGLVDQVDEQRVPPKREERLRGYGCLIREERRPPAVPVEGVPREEAEEHDPEPG